MRLKIRARIGPIAVLAVCLPGCSSQMQTTLSPTDLEAEFREQILHINHQTGARQMGVADLMERLERGDDLLILDIREPQEFQIGAVADAVSLPPDAVSDFAARIEDQTIVVTYCTVGYRSGLAAVQMEDRLGRPVYSLDGGIIAWFNQGGRVVDTAGRESHQIHPYDSSWQRFVMGRE